MNHDLNSQLRLLEISKIKKIPSTIKDVNRTYSYTFKICTLKGELENWGNIACKVGLHYTTFNYVVNN